MAAPVNASQIAQLKQATQINEGGAGQKTGGAGQSKFAETLGAKQAAGVQGAPSASQIAAAHPTQAANATQASQKVDGARQVEASGKVDKASLSKMNGAQGTDGASAANKVNERFTGPGAGNATGSITPARPVSVTQAAIALANSGGGYQSLSVGQAGGGVGKVGDDNKLMDVVKETFSKVEEGGEEMQKLITGMVNGDLTNQEMIGAQAKIYSHMLQIDLTGKVVQQGTSGLKETLKTQV
jgi:hypothetical protein